MKTSQSEKGVKPNSKIADYDVGVRSDGAVRSNITHYNQHLEMTDLKKPVKSKQSNNVSTVKVLDFQKPKTLNDN